MLCWYLIYINNFSFVWIDINWEIYNVSLFFVDCSLYFYFIKFFDNFELCLYFYFKCDEKNKMLNNLLDIELEYLL